MGTTRQTLTEGGSLYGYTAEELRPHAVACHPDRGWLTERWHLAVHGLGCDHEHYRTETGALALAVKRPPTTAGEAVARCFRETGLKALLEYGGGFEAVCEEIAVAVLASLVKVTATATGQEFYVVPDGGP